MKVNVSFYVSDGEVEYNVGKDIEIQEGGIVPGKLLGKPIGSIKYILCICPICKTERFIPLYSFNKSKDKAKTLCKLCSGRKQGKIRRNNWNKNR